jgi:excisionase family DNA binding protein
VRADLSVAFSGDRNTPTPASEQLEALDLEGAARALGVHYQTAYRWVRTGVLPAVKIGAGYRLTAEDVQSLADLRRSGRAVSYTGRNRDWAGLSEQFYRAAITGDETGARRVFERLHLARVPMVDQCEQLVAPFARRLHDDFSEEVVLAGQVRLAATICERQLHWATSLVRRRSEQRALILTPSGERHRLPVVMASSVLRADRWAVAELDGDLEFADLLDVADRMAPGLIVVSPTVTAAEAKDLVAALGQLPVPIVVGGPGAPLQELVDAASLAWETQPGTGPAALTRRSRHEVQVEPAGRVKRVVDADERACCGVIQEL